VYKFEKPWYFEVYETPVFTMNQFDDSFFLFDGAQMNIHQLAFNACLSVEHVRLRLAAYEHKAGDDVTQSLKSHFPWEYYGVFGQEHLVEDIASMVNLTTNSLRLRLSYRGYSVGDDISLLVEQSDHQPALYRSNGRGITVEEISRQFKVCRATTRNRLKSQGFEPGDDVTSFIKTCLAAQPLN